MEANKQVITGENNLPELIQDKSGNVIGIIKANDWRHSLNNFNDKMKNTAEQIQKTAETAERVFGKLGHL